MRAFPFRLGLFLNLLQLFLLLLQNFQSFCENMPHWASSHLKTDVFSAFFSAKLGPKLGV